MHEDELAFLKKTGVDTRFVSIYKDFIFINNLRFSNFSKNRETSFLKKFPHYKVFRSKIFQRICTRSSRILAHSISPNENIHVCKDNEYRNFTNFIVLESYKRKYNIKINYTNDKIKDLHYKNINSIAMPITLDDEIENILNLMLNGDEMELLSSKKKHENINLIYPLIKVPKSWIIAWLKIVSLEINLIEKDDLSNDLLTFFEKLSPEVRENLYKSILSLLNNKSF
jgi:hypothetical protein